MLITTSYNPSENIVWFADQKAIEWNIPSVARNGQSISSLFHLHEVQHILVVHTEGVTLYPKEKQPVTYHPSMSMVGMKRLLYGDEDTLLQFSHVQKGDTVLDCTAGLGADAILFSYAVGCEGRVVALESEFPVFLLLQTGLQWTHTSLEPLNEAMRRIEVIHANHENWLKTRTGRSYDIVYFDPMFEQPVHASTGISKLRQVANAESILLNTVEQAIRVARKKVILKDSIRSNRFERLGFNRLAKKRSSFTYGSIDVGEIEGT